MVRGHFTVDSATGYPISCVHINVRGHHLSPALGRSRRGSLSVEGFKPGW